MRSNLENDVEHLKDLEYCWHKMADSKGSLIGLLIACAGLIGITVAKAVLVTKNKVVNPKTSDNEHTKN